MKKSLGVALSLSVVWSAVPAQAEFLKNFRVGGQIDVQATAADNVTLSPAILRDEARKRAPSSLTISDISVKARAPEAEVLLLRGGAPVQ